MGDDKKIFLSGAAVVCVTHRRPVKFVFPSCGATRGKVIKVDIFSDGSGVSVAGSEQPLCPPSRGEGVGPAGEVAQE